MKIAFNPSTVEALIAPPNNKDIIFDLRGNNIFARGVKFCGTDTNTWRDIKINNVSIGSNTLNLQGGSNTTLTNTNGVVTINSTWRSVVDNLTSDSTTSSLSAKQGKVLKALIDGKSNSGHTHDDRYLKLTGGVLKGQIILPDIDVKTSYTGSIIIGASNTDNLGIDGNEIMARNNGKASTLYLNNEGGVVQLGAILRTNSNIAYKGSQSTQTMIKFINNTKDPYGNGIAIGGGGLTIIGSGKSSDVVMGQHSSGGDKNMIIAGNGNIDFYSNLQDGWQHGKHMCLDTNGFLITPSYIHIGGNENNNSSPDRVWGSNSSDSYLRSYRTSALNVSYANSAGSASRVYGQVGNTGSHELVRCDMNNDQFRIIAGSSGDNNGWAEIATADDASEPIYVRQYSGVFSKIIHTLTLLDSRGNTIFPGSLSIGGNIIFPNSSHLLWNGGSWYQRILLTNDSIADTAVFTFQQSSNSGTNWSNLMTIRDNGKIIANTFVGALQGNASTATKLTSSAGSATLPIYFSDGKPIACTGSSVFSNLSSSAATNLSVTVAGQNRTIANLYARYLANNFTSRPTSMNVCYGDGTLRYFLATSSTTTSKPEDDSHILHFSWDNNVGRDSQLSIPITPTKHVQWRTMDGKDSNGNYIYNAWKTLANITDIPNPTNYYWANVKISASSSTTTSPTVSNLTATSSIKMSNILLEHTDEINNSANGGIHLNRRNSGDVSLCVGGGKVGIGTTSPGYKLHVNGNIYSSGQIIREGHSTIWAQGRDVALLRETSAVSGYHTLWSLKTTTGSWDFGESNTSGQRNVPVLSYITDSNYNSGNNETTYQITFPLASGTVALTSYGGDYSHPIFLGYLNLEHGSDGTVSSSFSCMGYSVPFTYTRGGNYCRIQIPDTSYQIFYIKAAIASVNYSGRGMDTWVGNHRGEGAWWLHCYASGVNEVSVKGFCQRSGNNDSWWGGNPLWSGDSGANRITVCIFGYVYPR